MCASTGSAAASLQCMLERRCSGCAVEATSIHASLYDSLAEVFATRLRFSSACELLHFIATDPKESGAHVEQRTIDILRSVKKAVAIPVAVKLSPFFSSVAHLAAQLDQAGADGLVLFNRFYQPDIDVEALEAVPSLHLSDSSELLLRLHWLAILCGPGEGDAGRVTAASTRALDAVKAVMAGASAVQVVSRAARGRPAASADHPPGA